MKHAPTKPDQMRIRMARRPQSPVAASEGTGFVRPTTRRNAGVFTVIGCQTCRKTGGSLTKADDGFYYHKDGCKPKVASRG